MTGGARVFAGVLVWRAIAAQRDAALLAGAEMDPGRTGLYTFLALMAHGLFDRFDRVDMSARFSCHFQLGANLSLKRTGVQISLRKVTAPSLCCTILKPNRSYSRTAGFFGPALIETALY